MFYELLVFETDLVDQLGIDDDPLMQRDGPRMRVGLRVVHRDLHLEMSEIGPPHLFAYLRSLRHDAAVPIDPGVVAQADRVDHERIAGPFRRRVTLPSGR